MKAIFTDDNGTTIKAREQQLSSLSSKCVDTRGNVKWCVARLAYLQDFDGLVNGVYLRHVRNRAFFDKKVAERAFVSHLMAVAGIEASNDNSRPLASSSPSATGTRTAARFETTRTPRCPRW